MNKEHINKVKVLLTEWNPLGKQSVKITDLNNYDTEATDILRHVKKTNTVEQINKIINTVMSQAFGIHLEPFKSKIIAEQIHSILNEK
ncbi:DUF1871 family protein [Olleya sp. HaHaR_3_96]|uniref:DUF1871 family protein n=1 Tax=Olleya sp. HaHaR_3_96 TaxID=2745560 RepID=UPI001C4FC929|nr:DUF1871 family protein [Olleya sp. HaHaR_3_96]QXP60859.1 DUF1871 family protein [Olleya sp. HaHaR_3_96]